LKAALLELYSFGILVPMFSKRFCIWRFYMQLTTVSSLGCSTVPAFAKGQQVFLAGQS
jgi:hypothetical protein